MALALALALGSGCAPRESVNRAEGIGTADDRLSVESVPVTGHRVVVSVAEMCDLEGELLATDVYSLWVQRQDGGVVRVPTRQVARVLVELYPGAGLEVGVITGLGTLSTVSHGAFLVLTAPMWLASGISSGVYEANANDLDASSKAAFGQLWQFARYPQGPPNILLQHPTSALVCE